MSNVIAELKYRRIDDTRRDCKAIQVNFEFERIEIVFCLLVDILGQAYDPVQTSGWAAGTSGSHPLLHLGKQRLLAARRCDRLGLLQRNVTVGCLTHRDVYAREVRRTERFPPFSKFSAIFPILSLVRSDFSRQDVAVLWGPYCVWALNALLNVLGGSVSSCQHPPTPPGPRPSFAPPGGAGFATAITRDATTLYAVECQKMLVTTSTAMVSSKRLFGSIGKMMVTVGLRRCGFFCVPSAMNRNPPGFMLRRVALGCHDECCSGCARHW
eukprot:GFKZ01004758.1.p1 GENE.GFKZ01004758.1~~GFKZ01004758.1.p1  ORF type:complete len:269 (+),score=-3.33 GFKZ01004758.1:810-1616(+)